MSWKRSMRRSAALLLATTTACVATVAREEPPVTGSDRTTHDAPVAEPVAAGDLSRRRDAETAAERAAVAEASARAVEAGAQMAEASKKKAEQAPGPAASPAPPPAKPLALSFSGGGKGGGGAVAYGLGGAAGLGVGSVGYGSGTGRASVAMRSVVMQGPTPAQRPAEHEGLEQYADAGVNPFTLASEDRLSTFSIDVDTGAYTLARRKINDGTMPAEDGVRVEEFLNFFRYQYAAPASGPLAVHMDAAPSPFTPGRHLLRVGVQGRTLAMSERKPAHLTFLVDVSGSMQSADKLPLAQKALRILVDNLRDGDTVGLVTYAGGVREVLPPTGLEHKAKIHQAIADLTAGGSTSMSGGIELAYQQASRMLGNGRNVRVLILSDGDANVGATDHASILKMVAGKVKEGVTCSVVGFGTGNYRDDLMEGFANKGNGNYAYVDTLIEARRIFQQQLGATLEVIAKDVKLQVEFDPAQVKRYRLVGYENRAIADRDFRNDKVDAGEVGSGHSVTALYEVELADGAGQGLATVRIRAKQPNGETADEQAFTFPASALAATFDSASRDLRFATAVMGAAEILRGSPHAKGWSLDRIGTIASGAIDGAPPALAAERREFVALVTRASKVVGGVAAR